MPLSIAQRTALASRIINAMQDQYEADGEEGDFADGERYLRDDASDQELLREEAKWCKKK